MENIVSKAAFSLINIKFPKVYLNYDSVACENELLVDFQPSGIFHIDNKTYELKIDFLAFDKAKMIENPFIKVTIISEFDLKNVTSVETIPSFFYKNSIAIVYPYIRAFVSNITLQANFGPLVLPTLNLSMLEDTLIKNTTTV